MAGLTQNYLRVAFRNFRHHPFFTLINLGGLTVGMVAFLLIMHYVSFEYSYDQFHQKASEIYRITLSQTGEEESSQTQATTYPGIGTALQYELPEVLNFARLIHHEKIMPPAVLSAERSNGEIVKFREEHMFFADASFLKMFSFPIKEGDVTSALSSLNSVVLTSSAARRYFGNESPLGKIIMFDGDRPLTVTAVLADIPENSHLQFDVLLSYTILQQEDEESDNDLFSAWKWPAFYTYVQLDEQANAKVVEDKLPALVNKYTEQAKNSAIQLALQPITDIHLHSDLLEEVSVNSSSTLVFFLIIIAVGILGLALINYSNLTTAKAVERAKEVALRKTVGASRGSLISQLLIESVILNGLGLLLGLGLVAIVAPFFNQLVGKEVMLAGWWQALYVWQVVGIMFVSSGLIAGLYPALLVSSFQPKYALKGKFSTGRHGLRLRRVLVTFQFAVSVSLVAVTITVYQQLSYMQNKDLGYQAEQLLIVKAPTLITDMAETVRKADIFKNAARQQVAVEELTVSNEVPGRALMYSMPMRKVASQPEESVACYWISTDEHFLETFQTELVSGRNFRLSDASAVSAESDNKIMLNERAVQMLGFANAEEALQQQVLLGDKTPAEIIGVVENFHQNSLKENYDPLVFQFPTYYQTLYFTLKVDTDQLASTLNAIQATYEDAFPNNPFEYFFLDEYFNRLYQAEQRFSAVVFFFSCLAIFIACLGLVGLTSFISVQKTKEIGIRKTLGASIYSIIGMLTFRFVRPILIASLLALPITYLFLQKWLYSYAFRINLEIEWMIVPIVVILCVALFSISLQTIKAAIKNPIDALRYE
ncbi:MAG: ABC transporter permease [Bacteroidota bacterium]